MLGHPSKNYYILKNQIQALMEAQVIKLLLEQNTVIASITTCFHIGQTAQIVMEVEPITEEELVEPIPEEEQQIVN